MRDAAVRGEERGGVFAGWGDAGAVPRGGRAGGWGYVDEVDE